MNPISNQLFSHDAVKYVFQDPDVRIVNHGPLPIKPFVLEPTEKSKKTKKDVNKEKQQGQEQKPS